MHNRNHVFGSTVSLGSVRAWSRVIRRHYYNNLSSLSGTLRDGDNIIVCQPTQVPDDGKLIHLRTSKVLSTHRGQLRHDDIIGKRSRDIVNSSNGDDSKTWSWRLHEPTLEQYVRMTPRTNTPIYGADASTIVSLLDLHPQLPSSQIDAAAVDQRFEILEAGTGHGSLTLYLARAISAANTAPPAAVHSAEPDPEDTALADELTAWKATRGARITTVDNNAARSKNARRVVGRYRRGMYLPHVDFHVGEAADHITDPARYSHIVFDLPSPELLLERAAASLRANGSLVVWVPSVTQVVDCLEVVTRHRLPLILDKAVEMGPGISSGRMWDIRIARLRAMQKGPVDPAGRASVDSIPSDEQGAGAESAIGPSSISAQGSSDRFVCRPKVGSLTFGGGFLGVFKRIADRLPDC